ncbi:endothelin-converting enzyme 1-like [Dermacentor albipictus]|uniref:endothelin-converting enzyme 1-like n=1 Tax=Dermacentor albipictus TaxID=60249 RepID=UPI0038FCB938
MNTTGVLNFTFVIVLGIFYGCLRYLVQWAAFLAYPRCDHPTRCFNYTEELAASIDRRVDPCDNLYEHVCASWDRVHPAMPSGQFSLLQGRISAFTLELLELPAASLKPDSVRRSVVAYQTCRNVYDQKRDDIKILFDVFNKFNFAWPSLTLPSDFDVMDFLLGIPLDYGLATPYLLKLQPYLKTDDRYGLTLEFSFVEHNESFQENTVRHCLPSIAPSVDIASQVARRVQSVYQDLYTIVANVLPTGQVLRNYSTVEDLASGLSEPAHLSGWLGVINKHLPPDIAVTKDEYVYAFSNASLLLGELLRSTKPSDYADLVLFGGWMMILQLRAGASYSLMRCFYSSQTVLKSAMGCLELVNEVAAFAVGRLLADGLHLHEAIAAAEKTWLALRNSTQRHFANLAWMDRKVAAGAADHVEQLKSVVSVPQHLRSDEALDEFHDYLPEFSQPFLSSYLDAVGRRQDKYKRLLRPNASIVVHREDIPLPMVTVNAYYMPVNHLMIIPTAIIAPPFVTLSVPDAVNYGAIGKVLGHELTHSFDPRLSNTSSKGDAIEWLGSYVNSTKLLSCVHDQLLDYTRSPTHARSAVSETFADTAGTEKAYLAFKTLPPQPGLLGYTQEQLFFVASSFEFCSRSAYDYRRTGLYPAVVLRCNLPAGNQPGFAAAFRCPKGAPLNPARRCSFH